MKRQRYAVYGPRCSSPLIEASLTECLRFISKCFDGYEYLTISPVKFNG